MKKFVDCNIENLSEYDVLVGISQWQEYNEWNGNYYEEEYLMETSEEFRQETNKMTEQERKQHLKQALSIIYGNKR